jgi:hypothetical protein
MVGIHLARKHALELQPLDVLGKPHGVELDLRGGGRVTLRGGQLEKLARVGQSAREAIETTDDLLELRALLAEILGTRGIVPDSGLLELARYFLKALVLVVVIKDTSSRNRCAPRDL